MKQNDIRKVNIVGDKIINFSAVKILPIDYDRLSHSIAKEVKDNPNRILYRTAFKYLDQWGYRYFVFTKEFFEDSAIDKIHFMKNECLEWAQANYGEI